MPKDLTSLLAGWPANAGTVQARKFIAADGQTFIQLRVDLGVLQMNIDGRPDGERPHGCDSMLDYMRDQQLLSIELTEVQHHDLSREMLQFYRRRISLMAMARQAQSNDDFDEADACYRRAIRDADHNLAILDLLAGQRPDVELMDEHELYRPFILMHRATCTAERALLVHDPDEAIEQLKTGVAAIQTCRDDPGDSDDADAGEMLDDLRPFISELRRFERHIRKRYRRRRTLREQLQDAVAAENFEQAAKIRDVLSERTAEHS